MRSNASETTRGTQAWIAGISAAVLVFSSVAAVASRYRVVDVIASRPVVAIAPVSASQPSAQVHEPLEKTAPSHTVSTALDAIAMLRHPIKTLARSTKLEPKAPAVNQPARVTHRFESEKAAALISAARPRVSGSSTSTLAPPDLALNHVADEQSMSGVVMPVSLPSPGKLIETRPASERSSEILAVLSRYAAAWNAKDVGHITALRPGIGKKTVKEELAGIKSIRMQIRPLQEPRIDGDRAEVVCMHQVNQVFDDGVGKAAPGVRMTYALVWRNGAWLIQDSRPN